MKNRAQKIVSILTIMSVLVVSSPALAAWKAPASVQNKSAVIKTIPVVTVNTSPTVIVPSAPVSTVTNTPVNTPVPPSTTPSEKPISEMTPVELIAYLSQYLTPEQIAKLIAFLSNPPELLTPEQKQALTLAVQSLVEGAPYVLTQEQFDALIAALKVFAANYESGDVVAQIQSLVDELQKMYQNGVLNESEDARETAKALIIATDTAVISYSNYLIKTGLPTSTVSSDDQTAIIARLNDIIVVSQASMDEVQKIDTTDPASATLLQAEIAEMYFTVEQTSYFQKNTRPVFGATNVKILEPTLRYALEGVQMASEKLNQRVDFLESTVGYADSARAQIMGINYLVGRRDVTGVTNDRINKAIELANAVIYQKTSDYAGLQVSYAVNNMVTAVQMMQEVMLLDVKITVSPRK